MSIRIVKREDFIKVNNIVLVLYGQPGVGKSSLGFSADKPLLLDFDGGVHRAQGRKDCVAIQSWNDIADLNGTDLANYNTIVIDTVGRALEMLAEFLVKNDPKLGKRSGELQIAGYGALGVSFKAWIGKLKSFQKDIIIICHDKEEKNGDTHFTRFEALGGSKSEISKISDAIGYYCLEGKKRTLDFNPTENHLGKNSTNIDLLYVPSLETEPAFMEKLILQIKEKMNAKTQEQKESEDKYNMIVDLINACNKTEDCTSLTKQESITKNVSLKHLLMNRATSLGFTFNKETKVFEQNDEILEVIV